MGVREVRSCQARRSLFTYTVQPKQGFPDPLLVLHGYCSLKELPATRERRREEPEVGQRRYRYIRGSTGTVLSLLKKRLEARHLFRSIASLVLYCRLELPSK